MVTKIILTAIVSFLLGIWVMEIINFKRWCGLITHLHSLLDRIKEKENADS